MNTDVQSLELYIPTLSNLATYWQCHPIHKTDLYVILAWLLNAIQLAKFMLHLYSTNYKKLHRVFKDFRYSDGDISTIAQLKKFLCLLRHMDFIFMCLSNISLFLYRICSHWRTILCSVGRPLRPVISLCAFWKSNVRKGQGQIVSGYPYIDESNERMRHFWSNSMWKVPFLRNENDIQMECFHLWYVGD